MSEKTPDPYLAQTGFDLDADTGLDGPEAFEREFDDADDELDVEEERAREN